MSDEHQEKELPPCNQHEAMNWDCQACIEECNKLRMIPNAMAENRSLFRRWLNGESEKSIYPHMEIMSFSPAMRTMQACAEAYLAEHPTDDGEPLDYEFLDGLLTSKPGRGWIVNESLSIFSPRRGFVLIAGQGGANDSEEE